VLSAFSVLPALAALLASPALLLPQHPANDNTIMDAVAMAATFFHILFFIFLLPPC